MPIINISQKQEKWDLEFFQLYIPALVAELQSVQSTFEKFARCLSEMHNRLSLVMMEETPRFKIEMTQDLYDKVRQIAFDIQSKNQNDLQSLSNLIREIKGSTHDLSSHFKESHHKYCDVTLKKQKIQIELCCLQKQFSQVQNFSRNKKFQCSYSKKQPLMDLNCFVKEKKQQFLRDKISAVQLELDELEAKQQLYCLQENNQIKMDIERIKISIGSVLKYQNALNLTKRSSIYFHRYPKQIQDILKKAEQNCKMEFPNKMSPSKARVIMQEAVLAVSKLGEVGEHKFRQSGSIEIMQTKQKYYPCQKPICQQIE